MRSAAAVLWFVSSIVPSIAHALPPEGEPIDTSDYTIDLHQGPVLAGSRVVGLAGAYAAIAEGIGSYPINPAAVAHRVPWSQTWFDWGIDGGFTLPGSLTEFDFDNNGDDAFPNSTALYLNGGLGFQFGDWGLGLTADWQLYQLEGAGQTLNVNIWRVLLVGGYGFLDNELIVGIGAAANIVTLEHAINVEESQGNRSIGSVTGPTFHAGLLWAPTYAPIRVGAGVRYALPPSAQSDARPECIAPDCVVEGDDYIVRLGDPTAPSFERYLPRTISLPNEIHVGAAFQLFRPLNFGWHNPHDAPEHFVARAERLAVERKLSEDDAEALIEEAQEVERQHRLLPYKAMERGKLLFVAGARITFPAHEGVGLESFLSGEVERSGEAVTVQPHGAIETEVWPGYLVLRGGSYLEPSRFRDIPPRIHGTGGLDIRIPIEWSVFGLLDDDTTFRVGGAVDFSDRYFGWGVGAGLWR